MPEEVEIETKELQAAIEEMHEEREERQKEEREAAWTRYIALATAFLAVFAAIAALQSGSLANKATIAQLKASDAWSEYESDRQKEHLYTLQANALIDSGAKAGAADARSSSARSGALSPNERLDQYLAEVKKEAGKEQGLSERAKSLEESSERQLIRHDRFARSVALIQVAIALSAVAALTKSKPIWFASLAAGAIGIVLFFIGFV
jgi:hypothetical protein